MRYLLLIITVLTLLVGCSNPGVSTDTTKTNENPIPTTENNYEGTKPGDMLGDYPWS